MLIKYMKVSQKNESFFVVKFKVSDLSDKVNFHFRNPFGNEKDEIELYDKYIARIRKLGIDITSSAIGIQRRLDYRRIKEISDYLNTKENSFFPSSIILALDPLDISLIKNIEELEENEYGVIDIDDSVKLQIVDGQHRLAGLFSANDDVRQNFELLAVLLINATPEVCASIFADVNGTQTKVNRSVIYDLLEIRMPNTIDEINLKKLHDVSAQLNGDKESPLYKHVKMLGIGSGAISQAFLISAMQKIMKSTDIDYDSIQVLYSNLFLYCKAFQKIFPDDWPVIDYKLHVGENFEIDFYRHSNYVLKTRKSQLLKTNGFGAILLLFPIVYKQLKNKDFIGYYNIINKLHLKIDWVDDDLLKSGTGEKTQNSFKDKLIRVLNI